MKKLLAISISLALVMLIGSVQFGYSESSSSERVPNLKISHPENATFEITWDTPYVDGGSPIITVIELLKENSNKINIIFN